MTDEPEELLLDSALEEILGGAVPPDLSGRIMQSLAARLAEAHLPIPSQNGSGGETAVPSGVRERVAADLLPPPASPAVPISAMADQGTIANQGAPLVPQPVVPARLDALSARGGLRSARRSNWQAVAAALLVLAIGLPLGIFAWRMAGEKPNGLAKTNKPGEKGAVEKKPGESVGENRPAETAIGQKRTPKEDEIANRPDSGFGSQLPFDSGSKDDPRGAGALAREKPQPEADPQIIAFANSVIREAWAEKGIKPSPPATEAEWCRRVYLRLVGRIPTVEELQRFTSNPSLEKRAELVNELVSGEAYREAFARHWAEYFANVFIGRTAGSEPEGPVSREGLLQYLRQAFLSDKPYDQLAFELLTATGSGQPGSSDYNGAANFLLANLNEKGVLATSRTSRVFLGKQLQCAQCHNHPSNDWSQSQFWELNAWFRQTHAERDRKSGEVRLVNRDFAGETGDPAEADVFYEVPSGRMKVAYPAFPGAPPVSPSGLVSEIDRRRELAKRLVTSEDLARSLVNRLWGHFFGFGFTRPVDDMGPHNPPSHPALLDRLAHQFEAHEYRLSDLMRWIVLSEPFGLSSKAAAENLADAPEAGEAPLFARYYTRQMQPEQVFESLQIAAAAQKNGGGASELAKARLVWLGQFNREMGTDDGEEQNTFTGDIRQTLIMMHGPLMQRATSGEQGSLLARVVGSKLSFEEKVEHLFLAALSRKPVKRELELASKIYADRQDAAAALQDIWWAVLNSNEFILDH